MAALPETSERMIVIAFKTKKQNVLFVEGRPSIRFDDYVSPLKPLLVIRLVSGTCEDELIPNLDCDYVIFARQSIKGEVGKHYLNVEGHGWPNLRAPQAFQNGSDLAAQYGGWVAPSWELFSLLYVAASTQGGDRRRLRTITWEEAVHEPSALTPTSLPEIACSTPESEGEPGDENVPPPATPQKRRLPSPDDEEDLPPRKKRRLSPEAPPSDARTSG